MAGMNDSINIGSSDITSEKSTMSVPAGERNWDQTSGATRENRRKNTDFKSAEEERDALRVNFEEIIGKAQKKKPANLAFVGPPGVGKSSVINTMIASITGDYQTHVEVGQFIDGTQKTCLTKRLPAEKYMMSQDDQISYPTLIDIAGFQDEESQINEELLRIVFYGRLPENTALKAAQLYGQKNGMDKLRDAYHKQEGIIVDRIIFIAAADEPIPSKLIKCVLNAARPNLTNDDEGKQIPVFGVLTKADKIGSGSIADKEQEFRGHLGLIGAKQKYALLKNYTDEDILKLPATMRNKNIPELDIPVLIFLNQVCHLVNKVEYAVPVPTGPGANPLPPRPPSRDIPIFSLILLFVVKAVILAILVQVLILPLVDFKLLNKACAGHAKFKRGDITESNNNVTVIYSNPSLDDICENKMTYPENPKRLASYVCYAVAIIDLGLLAIWGACRRR